MTRTAMVGRSVGVLLFGLFVVVAGGCGSGGGSTSGSSSSATATASTDTADTAAATTTTGTGADTKAGTKLALGTPATVSYEPGDAGAKYKLKVTAISITKAPKSDFNGVELEKAQQEQTPYYVKLSVRNEGEGNAAAESGNPTTGFTVLDDRGQPGQELTLLGSFKPCDTPSVPKQFTKGVTYTTCNVYMVGGSGSIKSVAWTGSGGDEYGEHPIVWGGE